MWRKVGYERAETRSNQMHFTIEFQAGEEESDSHLRGKREKKIWERETRGVSRSAATVSVCLMLIERVLLRASTIATASRFDITVSVPRTLRVSRSFFILQKNVYDLFFFFYI